jgi:hypothetical protein
MDLEDAFANAEVNELSCFEATQKQEIVEHV